MRVAQEAEGTFVHIRIYPDLQVNNEDIFET